MADLFHELIDLLEKKTGSFHWHGIKRFQVSGRRFGFNLGDHVCLITIVTILPDLHYKVTLKYRHVVRKLHQEVEYVPDKHASHFFSLDIKDDLCRKGKRIIEVDLEKGEDGYSHLRRLFETVLEVAVFHSQRTEARYNQEATIQELITQLAA